MNLVMTDPPGTEPLTLEEAKAHLRIDHDADDDAIEALIRAARDMAEAHMSLALITRGYSLYLDAWETDIMDLPMAPLQAVEAVRVYSAADSYAVFPETSYTVDDRGRPARIALTGTPPSPSLVINGIEIVYTSGFGDTPEDVPSAIREGIKRLVAHLYMNRGDAPDTAIRHSGAVHLFQPYRVMRVK